MLLLNEGPTEPSSISFSVVFSRTGADASREAVSSVVVSMSRPGERVEGSVNEVLVSRESVESPNVAKRL